MNGDGLALALTLAFALDMMLGDPLWFPHPIRWMGLAIEWAEPRFRRLPTGLLFSGAFLSVSLVVAVWVLAFVLVAVSNRIHPAVGIFVQTILIFSCLSARSLAEAAQGVGTALMEKGLVAGRQAVAMIVGREVDRLDDTAVTRAAVETVSENLVDGFVSPVFFALIGGAPLAMAYKMVNTLDSMIGYKNDRYILFGRFAARMDDAANWIPARLSVPFIALAAQLTSGRGSKVLAMARQDGRCHASPNAGYPEAAFAGALGIWMGGPNFYHGKLVEKPVIGKGLAEAQDIHINQACRLMLAVSVLVFLAAAVTRLLFYVN